MSYQITSALFGLTLGVTILWLIRRDHLHTRYASWWLFMALIIIALGFYPSIINFIAHYLGVFYPPTLLFVIGLGLLLIKILLVDIQNSNLERKCRRLTQRLALVEHEVMQRKQVQRHEEEEKD